MNLKRPDDLYLSVDGNGNAEMRVKFRRENIPFLSRAMKIVDDILAIDEDPRTEIEPAKDEPDAALAVPADIREG